MNYKDVTVATYDASAHAMAAHFQRYGSGVAKKEIDEAFKYISNPKTARVVEIGCGAGKEAAYLVEKVGWYQGFDPSIKLLALARQRVPQASFVQADASQYAYPKDLDAVFAFASLLHIDKSEFVDVCRKVAAALRPGGVFCMTLKEAEKYQSTLQEDEFGKRLFYLYNPTIVCKLAGEVFEKVFEEHQVVGPKHKPWFSLILRAK